MAELTEQDRAAIAKLLDEFDTTDRHCGNAPRTHDLSGMALTALERAREAAIRIAHNAEVNTLPDCNKCEIRNGHLYRCSYHEGADDTAANIAARIDSLTIAELLEGGNG